MNCLIIARSLAQKDTNVSLGLLFKSKFLCTQFIFFFYPFRIYLAPSSVNSLFRIKVSILRDLDRLTALAFATCSMIAIFRSSIPPRSLIWLQAAI
jgi:hypothetical protein